MEGKIVYFDKPGTANTDETLRIAKARADELGVKSVVLASTEGNTAAKAVDVFEGMKVVAVSHAYGRQKANPKSLEFKEENRQKVISKGGHILTCTHAFTGIDHAMYKRFNTHLTGDIIAGALAVMGQGFKVICEIVIMAADAGLVNTDDDIIAIAGTHRGADTAVVLTPDYSLDFFYMGVKEILCKPYSWPRLKPLMTSHED